MANENNHINVEDFSKAIAEALLDYTQGVTDKVKQAVDIVADEVNTEIKNKIPFNERTGKYAKAFRIKTAYEDRYNKRKTWHVVNGQHRLTHLLEFGHAKVNGGRVEAYPHIQYGEELAIKRMEELVKEAVEG